MLPTRLTLFGMITNAQPLSRRVKTIQCSRCWKWHNSRSCARNPCCRLCGSTQHTEEGHTNHCAAPSPHICPPRCLHCHGPHPADYEQCLLRPGKAGPRCTKAQQAEIRKTCSLNLAKARSESKCCTQAPVDVAAATAAAGAPPPEIFQDLDMPTANQSTLSPFRPTTPPPQGPADSPPITSKAVRFATPQVQNRFDTLMDEEI
jgi:hypothetical protein